jgi:hypothetical protein
MFRSSALNIAPFQILQHFALHRRDILSLPYLRKRVAADYELNSGHVRFAVRPLCQSIYPSYSPLGTGIDIFDSFTLSVTMRNRTCSGRSLMDTFSVNHSTDHTRSYVALCWRQS